MFVGMLICLEVGRRLGIRRLAKRPRETTSSHDTVESAVYGLYGLLIAFAFSHALWQLDARIQLIQNEANAITTAYSRLDLLATDSQPALRERFRQYVDSRLETFRKIPDIEAAEAELSKSQKLQMNIWTQALAATHLQGSSPDAAKLLLPALNDMVDAAATRNMSVMLHPPSIVFALLFLLALGCSLMAGYGMADGKQVSWIHSIGFVIITVITVFVILEIEYPRIGFIRPLGSYDQALLEVRQRMN